MDTLTPSMGGVDLSDTCSSPNESTQEFDRKPRDRYYSRRVAKVHDGYRSLVTCPICIDIFVDPHTLGPCGHSACGPCFFAWEGARVGIPTCPKCCQRVQQVARDGTLQDVVDTLLHSMNKNHEEGWMKGDHKIPKGNERESYEERAQAWKDMYSMIPKKSLHINSDLMQPSPQTS